MVRIILIKLNPSYSRLPRFIVRVFTSKDNNPFLVSHNNSFRDMLNTIFNQLRIFEKSEFDIFCF